MTVLHATAPPGRTGPLQSSPPLLDDPLHVVPLLDDDAALLEEDAALLDEDALLDDEPLEEDAALLEDELLEDELLLPGERMYVTSW
jgi:hypothetical protein